MILQSITLHNFMSYADACLDLTAISVACLSGANGAGKSALLDAVTWALWEEARAASDKLIRQEQKEMWVEVVFSHEGNTYRIRRSRQIAPSRSGEKINTKGSLDLHLNNSKQGEWLSLTAASMKETQQRIDQLLKMDYQTFVNSAYLRQGAADQFAKKMPGERKQILGEILGLSDFDRLQDLSREKLKPLKEKGEWLNAMLLQLPELETQINQLEGEKSVSSIRFDEARSNKDKLEAVLLDWQKKQHQVHTHRDKKINIETQLASLQEEIERLNKQRLTLRQRLTELKEMSDSERQLEQEFTHYEQTTEELQGFDAKFQSAQMLEKERNEARAMLAAERARLEQELAQLQKELNEFARSRSQLKEDIKNQDSINNEYKQYQELLKREEELSLKQESYEQIKRRIAELQTLVDEAHIRLKAEIDQKKEQLAKLQELSESDVLLEKQKIALEDKERELENKEKEFEAVTDKGQQLKAEIEDIVRRIDELSKSQAEYARKINELNKSADSSICPLCSATIVDRVAVIKNYEQIIEAAKSEIISFEHKQIELEKQRNILRSQYSILNTELSQRKDLDKQIGQFKEKSRIVKEAQLNEQKLVQEIALLEEQYSKKDYGSAPKESLIKLSDEQHKLEFDPVLYSAVQAQIRSQRGIESSYNQLQRNLAEIKKIDSLFPELNQKIETLQITLNGESYGGSNRQAMRDIESKLCELGYDERKHNSLKEELKTLLPNVEKYKDVKRALAEIPSLLKNIEEIESWLDNKEGQQLKLTESMHAIDWSMDGSTDVEAEILSAKTMLRKAQDNYELLVHEQAKLVATLDKAKEDTADLLKKKSELNNIRNSLDDFTFLAECFGKKGIQAIIIENAIPEIESDANRLLGRLTDNKMHVSLITQQRNKSGNVSETLDIVISDELGQRSYELYSGGEAFKVNFAIRVALSRLLARRAGAKLETLIIDEGFGSQDDSSRDKLVKAINSIQSDFARILVITHFSDVKEMFPNHILINKSSGTSQIQLIN